MFKHGEKIDIEEEHVTLRYRVYIWKPGKYTNIFLTKAEFETNEGNSPIYQSKPQRI